MDNEEFTSAVGYTLKRDERDTNEIEKFKSRWRLLIPSDCLYDFHRLIE